jgi:energy-converting hydrogenase Eha subunit F
MLYRILADLVVGVHALFVAFVMFGGLLALRWPRVAVLHLPAAVWGALIEFEGWICPLTPLEKWLRAQGGAAGYPGGFIEHYLLPVLYPAGLTRGVQLVLGSAVVVVNLLVYGFLLVRLAKVGKGRR